MRQECSEGKERINKGAYKIHGRMMCSSEQEIICVFNQPVLGLCCQGKYVVVIRARKYRDCPRPFVPSPIMGLPISIMADFLYATGHSQTTQLNGKILFRGGNTITNSRAPAHMQMTQCIYFIGDRGLVIIWFIIFAAKVEHKSGTDNACQRDRKTLWDIYECRLWAMQMINEVLRVNLLYAYVLQHPDNRTDKVKEKGPTKIGS